MDGTLVDSTAVVERLWLEWAKPHDLDSQRVLRVIHGRQGHQSMAILLPERDHAINLVENQEMLARETGDVDGVVAIDGAQHLLASLARHPHAIDTSADDADMTARMDAAGIGIPELPITAESVSASKPHPEGFLKAASLLGVEPADCVVFEDSPAGIQAGLAAGMIVIGVGPHAAANDPTYAVGDLTAITIIERADGFELTIG
jgi:sugar-phosphatase